MCSPERPPAISAALRGMVMVTDAVAGCSLHLFYLTFAVVFGEDTDTVLPGFKSSVNFVPLP